MYLHVKVSECSVPLFSDLLRLLRRASVTTECIVPTSTDTRSVEESHCHLIFRQSMSLYNNLKESKS